MNRELILKISLPLLTFLIAWLGALSNISTDRTWYDSLNKSSLNPPDYLFGIVLADTLHFDGSSELFARQIDI